MTQSMFLIGLVLRQPTACLWLCESRWLTFLAHILCAQGTAARSSLSSYCESDNWPKCHAIHSLVFSSAPPITTLDLLLEDYMPEILRSLYVTVHSPTSACQTPSSNTGNFLQFSDFWCCGECSFSGHQWFLYSKDTHLHLTLYPCWKHPNIHLLCGNIWFHPDPPPNKIHCFPSAIDCVKKLGLWYTKWQGFCPTAPGHLR